MHLPVLTKEVISYLDPQRNENFIDATFGEGGHAQSLLVKTRPRGKLLGIDQDPRQIEKGRQKPTDRLRLVNDNFVNLKKIVEKEKFADIDGIIFDLGLSSWHLEESAKGFSFLREEPLLMRLDGDPNQLTARDVVNHWPEKELERIFREYGEERWASGIAKLICARRIRKPIESTLQLARLVETACPRKSLDRIHPATRTFLALRICVNRELENLERALPQALEVLKKRGRLLVISFHSLEDRRVKDFFREQVKLGRLKILTPKPVTPGPVEIKSNPRSRSAKLRAGMKI
ncbi:MAG: 16S rRNA (cytosine(1402)-N(4))-methyltransferase RsmH [Candidatus Nealsonbacteria bacterium]|nr:16S rRNA (cytosine(1402)-N(4))-methyltransferase RsmH [Candidatus Nealsonbacteria bacterium]